MHEYDAELERRGAEEGQHKQWLASLSDIDREIAMHLGAGEGLRENALNRIGEIAARCVGCDESDLSGGSVVALRRAREQGNYSSLEALDRELSRQIDEEEQAVALLMAN